MLFLEWQAVAAVSTYSGCQKNVPVFKRFFLQPYIRLCRNSVVRNIIMESGIKSQSRGHPR
jgi:hypothetical protein